MAEGVFNYGQVTKGNQLFFLNGSTQVPGVQSISNNFTNSAGYIDYFGINRTVQTQDGPQIGSLNINSLLVSTDQFLQYTGDLGFNGYIVDSLTNTEKNFSFTSGYLNTYSCRGSLGEVVQTSVGVSVLGDVGRLNINAATQAAMQTKSTQRLMIPGIGCVSMSFGEFDTNAIKSFDINISCQRIPVYRIGIGNIPSEVKLKYPLDVTANFEMTLNDYSPKKLSSYPFSTDPRSLTLTIRDFITNDVINTFSFSNMVFQGESYQSQVDRNVSVGFSYRTQQFR